jgi:predicted secreted hydrolase
MKKFIRSKVAREVAERVGLDWFTMKKEDKELLMLTVVVARDVIIRGGLCDSSR